MNLPSFLIGLTISILCVLVIGLILANLDLIADLFRAMLTYWLWSYEAPLP